MIRKSLTNIINKAWDCKISQTRHSALFINGAKATEHFVYVTPHIDFSEKIQHKETLLKELLRRKANIDLVRVENLWQVYEDLNTRKLEYTKRKDEISRELGKLIKSEPDSDNTKKLKIQSDIMRDNLKKLKAPLWSAEEAAIVEVLKLPNSLHSRTPDDGSKVLYTHLEPPTNAKNHLIIGKDLNIIDFKKNENYYLKGDAALFELGAKFYFDKILKENKYIQFSNPDFVKSLVVEGCGFEHTSPDSTFILHHNEDSAVNIDNRMHLVGGASLCSFLAYHAKNVLYPKVLPLKYFTMGRQYLPSPCDEDSLFHVSQSSVIEFFGAAKTADDVDKILEDLTGILKDAYGKLGFHFRLVLIPAEKLHMWESLRLAVQMYSTSLKDYIEVANVSISGDFISKRLMFMYVEDKQNKFPHLISGTLLNVPKFLACVLEQDVDFSVPDLFKVRNWAV
ncbi:serine--tRNA synthetase-like protein Slimp [Trichoplusia ni]|uniref:serine--tRNA ligase n=1 Tax=Trichoplusia ni TaxID=7111 RepID=A0A7E5VHP5_TRINI|nr:serine--tRNA synthetase-like protein Slimp [Trichoplusia ni]